MGLVNVFYDNVCAVDINTTLMKNINWFYKQLLVILSGCTCTPYFIVSEPGVDEEV